MGAVASLYCWSIRVAAVLAFAVVVLGATVRLSNAGLACPDWPGCYGYLRVSDAMASPEEVQARWPDWPLHPGRARIEMFHRYAAGVLGLLILAIAAGAWRKRRGRGFALALLGLVVFQAMLGMWTVTLALKPAIVTAHLIGGLAVLAALWWLVLETASPASVDRPRASASRGVSSLRALRFLALAGLGALTAQIALGGWTSANHAALVCQGFPTCNGAWWPPADFASGFLPGQGGPPDAAGAIAIHWAHRLGALAVLAILGTLALATTRASTRAAATVRRAGLAVGFCVLVQAGLGIGTVLAGAPLPLAAAHNAGAALVLLALLTLNHRLAGGRPIDGEGP
jgi:cytochrome c oxidase assembly protein subunit 15